MWRAVVVVFCCSASLLAQTEEPLIRITVGLVQVDAVVTDGKGGHITDLTKDEFVILQDGEPREITSFSFIDLESGAGLEPGNDQPAPLPMRPEGMIYAPSSGAAPSATAVRRTYALLIDDLGLSFSSIAQLRRRLRRFVDDTVRPGDLVAVVRTSAGVGALQDFTTDPARLKAAIQAIRWSPIGRRGVTPFAAIAPLPVAEQEDPTAETSSILGPGVLTTAGADGTVPTEAENLRQRIFTVGTLGALQHTILGMGRLPGRKALVFFSESMELFTVDESGFLDSQTTEYRRVVDAANRAGVAIYTVDPRGLVVGGLTAEDSVSSPQEIVQAARGRQNALFDSQGGMDVLARQTGGKFYYGYNNLEDLAADAVADMSGYYLLGYRPDDETFDREFHRIEVKVTRRGARVRSRRGFFGVAGANEAARPEGRDEQLSAALLSPFGASDIAVRLTAAYVVDENQKPLLHAMTHIAGENLTYELRDDGRIYGAVDVLTVTYGANGEAMDQSGETLRFDLPAESLDYIKRAGFLYSLYHPLQKPGAYQMRLAARDSASGRVGAASQFVEIPKLKKNRVELSSVYFGSDRYFAVANAEPAERKAEGSPVLRRFRAGDQVQYRHLIMNARQGKNGDTAITSQARIWRSANIVQQTQPLAVGQTEPRGQNPRHFWGEFALRDRLPPGEYFLEVVVTDSAGREPRIVRQWTDFSIVPKP